MTELSFLIDLLLNHELPKPTKEKIANRITEVEGDILSRIPNPSFQQQTYHIPPQAVQRQAASTLALMAKHGDIPGMVSAPNMPPIEPVAVVAQTPATAEAMSKRATAIAASLNREINKETGRPRKF